MAKATTKKQTEWTEAQNLVRSEFLPMFKPDSTIAVLLSLVLLLASNQFLVEVLEM